ncbi:MAG: 3-deoxy-7-phosphoheptulonate synthase [Chthoniobacterales bacterium]|nr:3-deoxy-7-phosphoheptulonate synthase [Chthoniobacterales bacterium]
MPRKVSPAKTAAQHPLEDVRVRRLVRLTTPRQVKRELKVPRATLQTVARGRAEAQAILHGRDTRLLAIVGPCSIHDPAGALDYAQRLAALRGELADAVCIFMRVYFEKPRTTVGWKGLINDPRMDDSCDLEAGLRLARKILLEITSMGLPTGTEFLDPIVPQYIGDVVSWSAIGARTTESQTHREMASGLSMPVGFKNSTDGSIQTALDALLAARSPHSFLGIDQDGFSSVVSTAGNPDSHVVLRGGREGANYRSRHTAETERRLRAAGLQPGFMIDCSHANSAKSPRRQTIVWRNVLAQRRRGRTSIIGAMLESYIEEGNQPLTGVNLRYGVSVTDGCIDWKTTERLLRSAAASERKIRGGLRLAVR